MNTLRFIFHIIVSIYAPPLSLSPLFISLAGSFKLGLWKDRESLEALAFQDISVHSPLVAPGDFLCNALRRTFIYSPQTLHQQYHMAFLCARLALDRGFSYTGTACMSPLVLQMATVIVAQHIVAVGRQKCSNGSNVVIV